MIHYNYDCDFKIAEQLIADAPFRYTYYAKSEKTVVAEYDGTDYHGCYPMGDMLIVPVNARSLGLGEVKVIREYYLTDKDFTDGICNRVTGNVPLGIEIWRGETDGMETHEVKVVPAYQKGDPFTFDDMTDAQKQDIANRVPTKEPEREQAEAKREQNELLRQAKEAIRQENEDKRVDAEILRQEAETIREATYKNKVDRDDNAPKLTAGFANNLVGRGEATPQEISFRPSGGDTSIEDGTARIDRVKGSTVVWNQLADTPKFKAYDDATNNITVVNDGKKVTVTNTAYEGTARDAVSVFMHSKKTAIGHKILVHLNATFSNSSSYAVLEYGGITELRGNSDGSYEGIYTTNKANTIMLLKAGGTKAIGDTWSFSNIQVHDLTQMFGAGNEPTTIEEFNARKPIGVDEYVYNEGELISTNVEELKSVGFNAWDEEWGVGRLNPENGVIINATRIYSTNYIRVIQGKTYNINVGSIIIFYDENKKYVTFHVGKGEFTIPSGCVYIRFSLSSDNYGNKYNHDICINLSHTGYRNGEYEPYKEFKRSIPIKDIKDGDGNQLFPNGLLSAGSVYDEITATKAIKRIGVVDMGTLSWSLRSGTTNTFNATDTDLPIEYNRGGVMVWKNGYGIPVVGGNDVPSNGDKTLCFYNRTTGKGVYINDSSYTNAAAFKAAMSGVMLYYELAEPIEVDLPEPLNLDYEVSDFGTEEVISDVPTAPMKADIIYQFNAVDRIRDNSRHTAEADAKLLDFETRIKALEAIVVSLTSSES